MSSSRIIAAIILGGVVITAHLALTKQAEWNGTISLEHLLTYTNRVLPNTSIPMKIPQTGIATLDNYLAFMNSFFYISLDARNVRAHWQGNHLIGTLSSIWIIMLLETHRTDRSALFTFMTYFLEFMGELLGIGLFTPIWCIVHMFMTSDKNAKRSLSSLSPLGFAILFGHVAPTLLMLRTKPDGEGLASQQIWTIARLFHPIFVFVIYKVFSVAMGPSASNSSGPASRRIFYMFSILASSFFHVSSLAYLLAPQSFPGWLNDGTVTALNPWKVLAPVPFWSESVVQKVDLETGVAIFLQWDWMCSSAAIMIWAAALYSEISAKTSRSGLEMLGQSLVFAILAGPGAAAAFLMQEREAALQAEEASEKKTQ
ncbi:hypothetical protein AC579_5715 [Lecanosticta acicola]|uniref:Uncharacterized protein n=1 Tax=Lecanosticta acicola TaxID=111012 RepID=A0AAI9EDH0_9PEZI|nr:hypothetical protein AC579_5715 [Lecanosticta acicola]